MPADNSNSCLTVVANNLTLDCNNRPITGIEEDVVLINCTDITTGGIVYSGGDPTTKIVTAITLEALTTGYRLEGVKQLNSFLSEAVVADDAVTKFRHSFNGQIRNLTATQRSEIDNLAGGKFVVVVDKKWKGLNDEFGFIVLGPQRGLELTVGTENSAEAEGVFTFTLASLDNALESLSPPTFFDTDRATSQTVFDNLFAP